LILSVLLLLMRIVQRTSAQTVEPMAMLRARSRRTQRCQGPHRESVQVYANRRALECDRDIPTRPCKSPRRPHTSMLTTLGTSTLSTCHWANAAVAWRMERGFTDIWPEILKPCVQLSPRRGWRECGRTRSI
jgi:hypothetical protein